MQAESDRQQHASSPPAAPPPDADRPPPPGLPVRNLERKALLLLWAFAILLCATIVYLLYARGVFEQTQELVLTIDDSEGVVVGMDITFSGFPIGRVRRIELASDGSVRIIIDIARKDAHWLRESSIFTVVRGLLGTTSIRAYSGVLSDPPLPDGAERPVLRGDSMVEIQRLLASSRELIDKLNSLSSSEGAFGAAMDQFQSMANKLNGPGGAMSVLLGDEKEARKITRALEQLNTFLEQLNAMTGKADGELFGTEGLLPQANASARELHALLSDTRSSLQKLNQVLDEMQAIGGQVREGTTDLGQLRTEVEASLRKVDAMLNELTRKWPFASDSELHLP